MKRISILVILTLLLIGNLVYANQIVYVNFESVNIRTGPSSEYSVMKSVPLGYPLKVLKENERWYKVELEDKTAGWVYKTMVFNDIPLPLKISELESELKIKTSEFEEIKSKFEVQAELNSELDKNLKETQQELDRSLQKNEKFEKQHDIKLAAIGIIILILGWSGGFVTGFLKRQTEDKRFIKMMVEANSLRKVSNSSF